MRLVANEARSLSLEELHETARDCMPLQDTAHAAL